ncbi:DUF7305 domain-containing protein [Halomonas sp. E19]|uniref:DUF7305 domain-containing protein n=1 Tax=Halomonas sp. E19 TaxID=3397247 RepID=UPI00403415CE
MKNQNGAALVVVLSMLAMSLILGLSGMQSSLIDERLAGNYRAASLAQMGAERAVAEAWGEGGNLLSSDDFGDVLSLSALSGYTWQNFSNLVGVSPDACEGEINCHFYLLKEEENFYIVTMGAVDYGRAAVSEIIFVKIDLGGGGGPESPFSDGVVGCEGVVVNGGGNIDSRVRTLSENADVSLTGGTYVEGDVLATGAVYTSGSGGVGGDIRANNDVLVNASVAYGGGVFTKGNVFLNNTAQFSGGVNADGNVEFNNGATLGGNLSAGGDVTFANTGAYVEGSVKAAGNIYNNYDSWKETSSFAGGGVSSGTHSAVSPVPTSECDAVSLPTVIEQFSMPSNGNITVGNWPRVNATVTPDKITSFDQTWNVQEDVVLAESVNSSVLGFEGEVPVIRTGDLTLTNGEMNVSGGDVVLFVNGNLTLGSGGGLGLTIDSGSTLTIFVTGTTHILSSTQMSSIPQVTNGRPTFSLYSTKEDILPSQSGVTISGSARAAANVYAPFANVKVTAGGGLNGSARGKTVEVSGGGGITYDEALGEVDLGGGGGNGNGMPSIESWK